MLLRTIAAFLALTFFLPADALARQTELFFSVSDAVNSPVGKQKLLDVSFYFAGQKAPRRKTVLGEWTANRSTRGLFRSDSNACQIAFLSALIALQERARSEGGDAVIDIVSATRGSETSSATEYRCVAGVTVAHVGLAGTVVRLR